MLIKDKGLRNEMGKAGHETVITNYSKERLVKDFKNLYLGFMEKEKIPELAELQNNL